MSCWIPGYLIEGNYFDITITYAKSDQEDICILIEARNWGKNTAPLTVLPTLWFRNQWSPALIPGKPVISLNGNAEGIFSVDANHPAIGRYCLYFDKAEQLLFTETKPIR